MRLVTQDEVRLLFEYDQLTGICVYRLTYGRVVAGTIVGWRDEKGYRRTKIRGKTYFLHKLIWLHVHGYIPEEIDHKDGDPTNNSLGNLRIATRSQNLANARIRIGESGLRGVKLNPSTSKWQSRIYRGRQCYFLGDFDTKEEAAAAYRTAADKMYGEFAIHNRPSPSFRRI